MEGYQQNKPNCFLTQGTHIFFFYLLTTLLILLAGNTSSIRLENIYGMILE